MGEGGEKRRWDKVGQGTPDAGPTTTSESIMSLPLGAEVGRVTCSTKNSLSYVRAPTSSGVIPSETSTDDGGVSI